MLNPTRSPSVPASHNVSAVNFDSDVVSGFEFPSPLRLIDSTLRKSLFTAGHATSTAGFQRMAEALGSIGVRDESININWSGSREPSAQEHALLSAIAPHDFGFTLNVYADTLLGNGRDPQPVTPRHTVDVLVAAGARVLAPGIVPAPDADAEKRQLDDMVDYFDYAKSVGVTTTITLAQVGLRDFAQMVRMANHAIALGATRLDLMDSSSSMSVDAMRVFVKRFRNALETEVPLTMHMHDEFGLASAGAIAAATMGASPDVSFNKMSYRAGFAAFEEVVLALEVLYGVDTGIDLEKIQSIAELVARETGLALPPLKALTGGYAYLKHMPGDAAAAIRTGQTAFPPISHGLVPARMGQTVTWVWGGLSSDSMVEALAESIGLEVAPTEVGPLRRAVDRAVAAKPGYPRWLEPSEAATELRRAVEILRSDAGRDEATAIVERVSPTIPFARLVAGAADEPPAELAYAVGERIQQLDEADLIDSLAGFGSLAEPAATATASAVGSPTAALSAREESGISAADPAIKTAIAELAALYETTRGHRYVIAADDLSGTEVLADLASRLDAPEAVEIVRIRREVTLIVVGRVRRALDERAGSSLPSADL